MDNQWAPRTAALGSRRFIRVVQSVAAKMCDKGLGGLRGRLVLCETIQGRHVAVYDECDGFSGGIQFSESHCSIAACKLKGGDACHIIDLIHYLRAKGMFFIVLLRHNFKHF